LPPVGRSLLNAWLSFTSNNTQKAAQYLEEAITIAPNTSAALRLLGHYYINEGANPERALNCFYRYLEAEWEHLPFDEVVEVCLLLAGLYSNTEGGAESALFYLEQANKFMPEDERIFTAQTQIMKQAAMWGHLQSLYESHIESPEPTDNLAELWFHLGQLHAVHLQNPEEAQLCYQKALQADPLHTASLQELEELNQASSRSFDV
jgi:tetratricopeptide (TPR) repeat protein